MPDGLVKELREVEPVALPERDVRAGKPLLSGVLRFDLLRAVARVFTLAAFDLVGLFLAIYTALVVKTALVSPSQVDEMWGQAKDYFPLGALVMLLLFARSDLYRERAQRPGFTKVTASLFQVTLIVLVYAIVEGEDFQSYYIFYGSLFFALLYVSAFRWGFEAVSGAVLRAAGYRRRAVLVGSGSNIQAVSHALRESREIEPYGFVARTPVALMDGLRDFRSLEQLERHFDAIDEVLIADADFPQEEAVELVDRCHQHGVRVRVAPSTMEILMDRVEFVPGRALPLFELKPPVFEGVDFLVKRSFDLVGSVLLLLLLSPVMLLAALAIRVSSRGPVFYRSMRPGIGGRPFACLKFRTMVSGAEGLQDKLEEHNELGGALFKIRDDPRITRVGRFLRRWSLDELPQLFNVLRGEMSLVGPRPLPQRDYDRLDDWHRKRYLVLPGMTGLWQVSGRSELDFDELVRLDFLYLERWSVFLDLAILLKTIPAVIRARGGVVSEPYREDNLLDRLTDADTLQVHYDQEMRREQEILARRLDLDGGDVLSVGCGWHPGRHLFPRPEWRMTGIDLDGNMIGGLLASGELDEGRVGMAGQLPFVDGSFDVVLYRLVLHHVAFQGPLVPVFAEAARLLRPGGALVAVEPGSWHPVGAGLALANATGLGPVAHGTPDDIPLSPRLLVSCARAAGLRPELHALTYGWRRLPARVQRTIHRLDPGGSRSRAARFGHTLLLIARR